MSQFRSMAFETPRSFCDGCNSGCANRWDFCQDSCYTRLGSTIDDHNIARNCSCNFRCCICGGWCGANCECVRCGNRCINNCERDNNCGCGGCGCNGNCGNWGGCGGCGNGCGNCGGGCGNSPQCGGGCFGMICIHKVDAANPTLPLTNAVYELQNHRGCVMGSGSTDAEGNLCFYRLCDGRYFLREITAPTDYQPNTDVITIDLTPDENRICLEITNARLVGTVTVTANSAASPTTLLPGVSVTLVNAAMESIATVVTNASGVANFQNIPFGTYTVMPLNTPAGYTPITTFPSITVSSASLHPAATLSFTPALIR